MYRGHLWCDLRIKAVGVTPPDSPKDLVLYLARHRFGTEVLRAGVPLKDVADLMGHASVTTTEIYLHHDVAELASKQDRVPELGPPEADRDLAGGEKEDPAAA